MSSAKEEVSRIVKTLEEITLIDNLLPRSFPKYINYTWSTKEVHDHYKAKLAEAGELKALIDKGTNDEEFTKRLHLGI